jgi:GTP-binding protein HflX
VRVGLGGPSSRKTSTNSRSWPIGRREPVATVTGRRDRPEPRLFVGSGKADEIRQARPRPSADVVLVDHALSPSQERNLEKLVGQRVLDRNALILDIFAQRARSHEGKLEVELAQLRTSPAAWCAAGPTSSASAGGIGLRGPGETQLETDRRLLGERVAC